MEDNNEHEAGNVDDEINDAEAVDDDDLIEIIYLGGRLDNNYHDPFNYYGDHLQQNPNTPHYTIPDDVPFRLIIHPSVTVINMYACWHCTMLTEVVFQHKNNVTKIGRYTFRSCSNLKSIELPEGLLRLEDSSFDSCTSLQQIVIPTSVQFIGSSVFNNCESLQKVVFTTPTTTPNIIVEFGGLFIFGHCSNLRSVTLPQNLQSIPNSFFYKCISLTHIQIPVSVERIEDGAFYGSGLRSIEISENVHFIGEEAWKDCLFLEKVTFYSTTNYNLITLNNGIFINCPSLSVINIYPWLWSKLFESMNLYPDFIFQFFRQYQTTHISTTAPRHNPQR